MTELSLAEVTFADAAAERAFARASETPALPAGCLRAERARTARPRTYVVCTWWTDSAERKAFEASGAVWPGAETNGVARAERTVYSAGASGVIRAACPDCGELVPVTVRPAGETCSICGASLPGRPAARAVPSPPGALPVGARSDLAGVDLDAPVAQAVEAYFAAWNGDDPAERARLLARGLADEATYQDPGTPEPLRGRDAIAAYIEDTRRRFAGISFALTHAYGRGRLVTVEWRMSLPTSDGTSVTPGVDVLEVAPDGRLLRIIAYYDRGPAVWKQLSRAFA